MKIEIITTKYEASKETGFGTIETCNNILDSITKMGHTVKLNVCHEIKDLYDVVDRKPDLVILAVKYLVIEDADNIWLCEFFEKHGINYSGSTKEVLMFDSDKVLAKSYLKDKGISTARYFTAVPGEHTRDYDIPIDYPLYLKPMDGTNGSSIDELSLVNNFTEFQNKVSSLYNLYNSPVLVEEYLEGQEFTVAIIKTKDDDLLVAPLEVKADRYERAVKVGEKIDTTKVQKLSKIKDNMTMERVKTLAIDAYIDLGIRDFGRIDIKSNKSGHCYFMSANLVPAMTSDSSYFTKACEMELELSYDKVIEFIVEEGISRANI